MNYNNLIKEFKDLPIKRVNWEFWANPEIIEQDGDPFLEVQDGDCSWLYLLNSRDLEADDWVVMSRIDYDKFFQRPKKGVLCVKCMTVLASWESQEERCCGCPNEVMVKGGKEAFIVSAKNMDNVRHIELNVKV